MKMSSLIASIVLVSFVVPAAAQNVATRAVREDRRILLGEKSGALSRGEATRLSAQQSRIDATIARDRAQNGGFLTASERASIHERQARASGLIYRDKHNAVVR